MRDDPKDCPESASNEPDRTGQVAVIFISRRAAAADAAADGANGADDDGYADAAARMERLAARQPGYCGVDSARGADGFGITISWWADEAAALAWRRHPDHATIRDRGRAVWYDGYDVAVTRVTRAYRWRRG